MTLQSYIKYLIPILLAALVVVTCSRNSNNPGREYMPDMTHSKAYETYTAPIAKKGNKVFTDGQTAMLPPEGAIPVGASVYDLPNTPEAYEIAANRLNNPIEYSDAALARGKAVYTIHCTPCHGPKGEAMGTAVIGSDYKLAAPPINFAKPTEGYLTPGRMFHTITHGKGNMGSYAAAVSKEDRWKVIHYIQSLNKSNTAEDSTTSVEK